jgi:hypothetical protein
MNIALSIVGAAGFAAMVLKGFWDERAHQARLSRWHLLPQVPAGTDDPRCRRRYIELR